MKITALFCLIFISFSSAFAQEIDERLLSKYSQRELKKMIETDSDQYNLLNYALDNALYVANFNDSKGGNFELITVDPSNLPTFVELDLEITDQNQYYKIDGVDKLLVVKSAVVLNYEMKKK